MVAKNIKTKTRRVLTVLLCIIILIVIGWWVFCVYMYNDNFNIAANMLVSFSCAMQVQAFRKVRGYGYASTMCIGNLRSGMESLSQFLRNKDRASLTKALHFFSIILFFAIGAGAGGALSNLLYTKTIWVSPLLLTAVAVMMIKENR